MRISSTRTVTRNRTKMLPYDKHTHECEDYPFEDDALFSLLVENAQVWACADFLR